VSAKGAAQVRHEEHVFPDWAFVIEDLGDHARAVMTRRKPVYDKE